MKKMLIGALLGVAILAPSAHAGPALKNSLLKECKFQNRQSYLNEPNTYYFKYFASSDQLQSTSGTNTGPEFRYSLVYRRSAPSGTTGNIWYIVEAKTGKCLRPRETASGSGTYVVRAVTCQNVDLHGWQIEPVPTTEVADTTSFRVISRDDATTKKFWYLSTDGVLRTSTRSNVDRQRFFITCKNMRNESVIPSGT